MFFAPTYFSVTPLGKKLKRYTTRAEQKADLTDPTNPNNIIMPLVDEQLSKEISKMLEEGSYAHVVVDLDYALTCTTT